MLLQLAQAVFVFLPLVYSHSGIPIMPGLFRTRGLERLITDLVCDRLFADSGVRCFATVAQEVRLLDPGEPREVSPAFFQRLRPSWVHVPQYLDLNRIDSDPELGAHWVRQTLSVTSALPCIFSARRFDRRWMFDGGVADNVPIGPLVTTCRCHRIFVLHLDHDRRSGLWTRETLAARLIRLEQLRLLEQLDAERSLGAADGESRSAEALRRLWASWHLKDLGILDDLRHCEIVHVLPSERLGGPVTGTLNFTGRKARWLIDLGQRDMARVLDEIDT